jgi:hypothetical protein
MPPRQGKAIRHQASSAADTLDESELFPGAMTQLANLVPAPDTLNHWVPRPAAALLAGSNTSITFISQMVVVGDYAWMMAQGLQATYEAPVGYNLKTNARVNVTGWTNLNTPANATTTGEWVPPTMVAVGVYVVVTHPGFSGTGTNFFGLINISNPAAPTWISSNCATNPLPSVPVFVQNFYNRAYFGCNPAGTIPAILASDPLLPATRTNPYALTFSDNNLLTAAAPLPLNNQLGGQIQALIVFQGSTNCFQVTGDFASTSNPIAQNALNIATGTVAPNTLVSTPNGLMFVAPDGLRNLDFTAHISDPIGTAGGGIALPFINSSVPSRMCAASNGTSIRITTQNSALNGAPYQEWVYSITRKIWSGPHTSAFTVLQPYGTTYIGPMIGFNGLYRSDVIPTAASVYTENGAALQCAYQTALLPERGDMRECSMVETVFYAGSGATPTAFSISALDQNNSVLSFASVSISGTSTYWDAFTWGSDSWLGTQQTLIPITVPWTAPVTFDRLSIQVNFPAQAGARIADLYMVYQPLGYTARA